MTRLMIALALLLSASTAWAQCSATTIMTDRRILICSTCCFGGSCSTTCV